MAEANTKLETTLETKLETTDEKKAETSVSSIYEKFDAKRQESILFLSGKTTKTSWHGPMEEETRPISACLAQINRLGLVTTTSQPGLFMADTAPVTAQAKESLTMWAKQHTRSAQLAAADVAHIEDRQRAYIECICLREDAESIMAALAGHVLIHCDGRAIDDTPEFVPLTLTTILTDTGSEVIVIDTKAYVESSKLFKADFFTDADAVCGLVIMDPFLRRNTLCDTVATALTKLWEQGKLKATLLTDA